MIVGSVDSLYSSCALLLYPLGVSPSRGYKIMNNVKKKWDMATTTHNRLFSLCKKTKRQGHWLARLLVIVKPQEPGPLEDTTEAEA